MPRSKTRKRNGQPVRYRGARYMRRPGEDSPELPAVNQADMAKLIDGLEEALRLVPTAYNPTNMGEAVEHHHHATAVINYLRENDMVGIFAALAGGDMLVMPDTEPNGPADPDAPALCGCPSSAAEADEHYSGCLAKAEYVWAATARTGIDYHQISHPFDMTTCQRSMASKTSLTLSRADAETRGLKPCPRCYGETTTVGEVGRAIQANRAKPERPELDSRCPVCDRIIQRTASGVFRTHGPRGNPCYGSGSTREATAGSLAAWGPVRTVMR